MLIIYHNKYVSVTKGYAHMKKKTHPRPRELSVLMMGCLSNHTDEDELFFDSNTYNFPETNSEDNFGIQ